MNNYKHFALEKLQEAGYKLTRPRKLVIDLLSKNKKVLTPYEMRDTFKKRKVNADVVTIYRILETLEKLSLVHKVLALNGYSACAVTGLDRKKNAEQSCHHYLVCKSCHRVDEVEGENLSGLEKKIAKQYQFKIQSHYLEFTGLCKSCRKRKSQ